MARTNGITLEALDDKHGISRYIIKKKRGKLTLDDVQDACREHLGEGVVCVWQWRTKDEDGNGWYDMDDNPGDCVVIEIAEATCRCPVCMSELDDNF